MDNKKLLSLFKSLVGYTIESANMDSSGIFLSVMMYHDDGSPSWHAHVNIEQNKFSVNGQTCKSLEEITDLLSKIPKTTPRKKIMSEDRAKLIDVERDILPPYDD